MSASIALAVTGVALSVIYLLMAQKLSSLLYMVLGAVALGAGWWGLSSSLLFGQSQNWIVVGWASSGIVYGLLLVGSGRLKLSQFVGVLTFSRGLTFVFAAFLLLQDAINIEGWAQPAFSQLLLLAVFGLIAHSATWSDKSSREQVYLFLLAGVVAATARLPLLPPAGWTSFSLLCSAGLMAALAHRSAADSSERKRYGIYTLVLVAAAGINPVSGTPGNAISATAALLGAILAVHLTWHLLRRSTPAIAATAAIGIIAELRLAAAIAPGPVSAATAGWLLEGAGMVLLLGAAGVSLRSETYEEGTTGVVLVASAAFLGAIVLLSQKQAQMIGLALVLDALAANALVISSHRSSPIEKNIILTALFSAVAALAAGFSPLSLWAVVAIAVAFCALYLGSLIATNPPHMSLKGILLRSWALLSVATLTLVQAATTVESGWPRPAHPVAEAGALCAIFLMALLVCDDQLFPNHHLMACLATVPGGILLTWLALLSGASGALVLLVPASAALLLCALLLRWNGFGARAIGEIQALEAAGLYGVMLATYLWGLRQVPLSPALYGKSYSYYGGNVPTQLAESGAAIAVLIIETAGMIALGAFFRRKIYAVLGTLGIAIAALLALNLLSSTYPLWEIVAGVAFLLLAGAGILAAWTSESGKKPQDLAKAWRSWD